MKCEPRRLRGLAPKGKKAKVESKKQERYQPRLDIGCRILYNKLLALDIHDSKDRTQKRVKGYGKKDVKLFLRKKVATTTPTPATTPTTTPTTTPPTTLHLLLHSRVSPQLR